VALTALLAPVASVAPAAHAQAAVDELGVEFPDRWWGVLGGVLCGAEIRMVRVVPAIGMNPYAIGAGLGGCLLAGLDVLTTQ
jgi:hypothetical protein